MDYIVGDPVTSAKWVVSGSSLEDQKTRAHQILHETLWIDDQLLSDDGHSIVWIPGTHRHTITIEQFDGHVHIKSSIEMFRRFLTPEDGSTLANNLNRNIVGGTHVYDGSKDLITVESYVVVTCWWDLSLFLYSLRVLISHVENIGNTQAITRWNFCQPATANHPEFGQRTIPHPLFLFAYPDMEQLSFIGGVSLFRRECNEIIQSQKHDLNDYSKFFPEVDATNARGMEILDVNYLVETGNDGNGFFNGESAEVGQMYAEWTSFGWAMTTHIALPYFTEEESIPRGMGTMQEAIDIANTWNQAIQLLPIHPLGLGTFWANRDQVNFTMSIPHTCIEPVIYGMDRAEVAVLFASIYEPEFIRRIVATLDMVGKESGERSSRSWTENDTLGCIQSDRERPVQVRNVSDEASDDLEVTWGYPTTPLVVLGVFDYLNTQITSLEFVETPDGSQIRQRVRTATGRGEAISTSIDSVEPENIRHEIINAIAELGSFGIVPTFIWTPKAISHAAQEWVQEGINRMIEQLAAEHDLSDIAWRMWSYPNPWTRTFIPEDVAGQIPETKNLTSAEQYKQVATEPTFIDFNIGLIQAFWMGAFHLDNNTDDTETALKVVDNWIQHFQDRMRGPDN